MQRKLPPTLQDVEGHRVASSHGLLWGRVSECQGREKKKLNFDAKGSKRHPSSQNKLKACLRKRKSEHDRFEYPPIFMLGILHILHMPKDCFVFLFVWPLGSILFMLHTDIKRRGCWFWVLWRFKTRLTSSHRSWWIGLSKIGKGHPVSRSPFWKCTQILISRIFMEG